MAFLRQAATEVQVVMVQETHIMAAAAIADAIMAAAAAGWHLIISPAIPSQGTTTGAHYNTGGVAIAVRQTATTRRLQLPADLHGRAVAAEVISPAMPGGRTTVASIYLRVGEADTEPNRNILSQVGAALEQQRTPIICGGDFQMSPRQLEDTGFAQKLGCAVAAPPPGHGTIRRSDGKQVAIDMFVATAGALIGTMQAKVQAQHRAVPHWPVEVQVSARTEMVPVFVLPKAGGADRIHGPTNGASQTMKGCATALATSL